MKGYSCFAAYYDALTKNVDYPHRADYFLELFARVEHAPGLLLDLACGTGSLTLELAARGVDVFGADASAEMLSVAQQKAAEAGKSILFLCQPMQRLNLFGTVDTVICALDSINHLTGEKQVQAAFSRVSLFLNPGGYFLFDVNTIYKHREVLGNNAFIYEQENLFCAWQNSYVEKGHRVDIKLDFFARGEDGLYARREESFCEHAYEEAHLDRMLLEAGLEIVGKYDDLSFQPPTETSERMIYLARKV